LCQEKLHVPSWAFIIGIRDFCASGFPLLRYLLTGLEPGVGSPSIHCAHHCHVWFWPHSLLYLHTFHICHYVFVFLWAAF
jgi:hypothetical protein